MTTLKFLLELVVDKTGEISEEELNEIIIAELCNTMPSMIIDDEAREVQVFSETWSYEVAGKMQPPETAPHDRRIIVYNDVGENGVPYVAEYNPCLYGTWKIAHGFWLWHIAGWKELP